MLTIHISRRVVFLLILGVLVAVPAGSWASHRFVDVPDSNIFHDDISWLADAGVTKGCNPPDNDEFCPSAAVTREQMAAFMKRLAEARVVDADRVDGQHASAFALKTDLPTRGAASCPGVGFYPHTDLVGYEGAPTRMSSPAGSSAFLCPLLLPDNATITKFTANLHDETPNHNGACALHRMDVTGGALGIGAGISSELATTSSTSGISGDQTVHTSDIDNPVVDARRYAYYASCPAGANYGLGINGVVVQYTLP